MNSPATDEPEYIFQLFITGATPNSTRAVRNSREICEQYLAGRYVLTIIDIYQQPELGPRPADIGCPYPGAGAPAAPPPRGRRPLGPRKSVGRAGLAAARVTCAAMPAAPPAPRDLAHENEELRQRLREAEELIAAVREGTVDSLAVPDATAGPRYATREGADHSYRTLVENMSEGAALLGPDGLVLYANAALASLLAAPLPQLPAGQLTPYVPAAYQPYWTELLTQAWATPVRAELPLRTTTGQLRPCAVSINALFINEVTSLALLVTDLSDRRRLRSMQAQMAEQTTRLHLQTQEISAQREATAEVNRILEGIPQIAWSTDVKGQNYYVNQRWADFTGERPVDFVRQLEERVHPDDRVAALARWLHSMRSGEPLEMEFRVRNAADDYRWLLARARPAHDEQGQLRQWIGTYTDIQEQKLTQARVEQTQRQLREKKRAAHPPQRGPGYLRVRRLARPQAARQQH